MDLVSIVLPVYNGEQYLSKSIDSILSQSYKNIELIIVNDCSTDNTAKIIDNYAKKDKRIKVVTNFSNKKLPESLNVGFSKANGNYYTWTSDDNLYKHNAIEWMVDYLSQNLETDLVSCTYDLIDENDNIIVSSENFFRKKRTVTQLIANNNVGACFLYRKSIARKVGLFDRTLFLAEDYDYWLRILSLGTISYVNKNLYYYRIHSKSLTSTNSDIYLVACKVILKNFDGIKKKIELSPHQIKRIKKNLGLKIFRLKHLDKFKLVKSDSKKKFSLYGFSFFLPRKMNSGSSEINYLNKYNCAQSWINKYTYEDKGIVINSKLSNTIYPEVSGYYIPTLIKFGYRSKAVKFADYLLSIQNEDGSWNEPSGKVPYTFDTGMILKGLCSLIVNNLDVNHKYENALIKGADYILSMQRDNGSIATVDYSYWTLPFKKVVPESIHIYCLEPIRFVGKLTHNPKYEQSINKALEFYLKDESLTDFNTLSHFNAYIIEGLIDIGETSIAQRAMNLISLHQRLDGSVSAYSNVDFVCSTGLFQYAVCWYKLGEIDKADKAFDYACRLQNQTGGWYGSYSTARDIANYFPQEEISWAVKYYLDAIYYRQKAKYNSISQIFLDEISSDDGRYLTIKNELASGGYKDVLDLGCGKARYTKKLIKDYPEKVFYCVDLSSNVLKNIKESVEIREGSILNIPYKDNSFDFIFVCEVLEHAIDIKNAVKELTRVLRNKGKIVIIDKDIRAKGKLKIESFETWFDKDELVSLFRSNNLDCKVKENIPYENEKQDGLFNAWIVEK